MFYLYVTVILALVAIALWAIVCFHYVLQQQRKLNLIWDGVHHFLIEKDELLGALQNLWVAPDAPKPEAHLKRLQELLAEDTAAYWQDVEGREVLHRQIAEETEQVLSIARSTPQLSQGKGFADLESRLIDAQAMVKRETDRYNKEARIYNSLLKTNPNRFMARRVGLAEAPLFQPM